MPSNPSRRKPLSRGHNKSAPNNGRNKQIKTGQPTASGIPSHIVAPSDPDNHFATKHIDVEKLRQSTDLSAVMQITHDIKIGFNRYDMFTDRFEKQKQVVRNNNFKLICGPQYKSKKTVKAEKQESVSNHIKNKRIVSAMHRLQEIGNQLDNECWGTHFVNEKVLDPYVDRLREQIKNEQEKGFGSFKHLSSSTKKRSAAIAKQKQQAQQPIQPTHVQPAQEIPAPFSRQLLLVPSTFKQKNIDSMDQAQIDELRKIKAQQDEAKKIVVELMDPNNDLNHMNKEEFAELLRRENVFDEVANRLFTLHNERNQKLNLEYPLMVRLETNVQQVKQVLDGIDQISFKALRDLKLTPSQLSSQKLQRSARIKYAVVDDLREIIGNENLNRNRFCGIINRLINQKAKEMGKLKKGYEKYYLDEITNHADELPADNKCIKSLLTKENILKYQHDEILAKQIIRQARAQQLDQKANSEERMATSFDQGGLEGGKFSLSRPRIKTLEEIQAEKAAMLKNQQEKLERDRQLVLDNIYLLRLREMYPDANITCSEHIENLINAYMRRNMVQDEIQKEIAREKLMAKKPRPFKIIRGLAVVRPEKYDYLDGDPLGSSRQGYLDLDDDDSNGRHVGGRRLQEADQIIQGQLSPQSSHHPNSSQLHHKRDHSSGKSSKSKAERVYKNHRVFVKQLDIAKVQEQQQPQYLNIRSAEADLVKEQEDDDIYQMKPFIDERIAEFSNDNDTILEKASGLGKDDIAPQNDRMNIDVQHELNKESVSIKQQQENTTDDQNADITTHHNDGILSQDPNWKHVTSSQTVRESYLASVENATDAKKLTLDAFVMSGEKQMIQSIVPVVPQSDHPSVFMHKNEVGRDSPTFQAHMLNNLMHSGMFEQKSEDISGSDSKLHASRRGGFSRSFNRRKTGNHRSARNQLELNKLRTYGIREPNFNIQRVRREAEERRGKQRQHLNLSGLKSQDNAALRFISSARTIEFNNNNTACAGSGTGFTVNNQLQLTGDRSNSNKEDPNMIYSGATTAQSFLNSQQFESRRKASVDPSKNKLNLMQNAGQPSTNSASRNLNKRFSQKTGPLESGAEHQTMKSFQTEGTSFAEHGGTVNFRNANTAVLKPNYSYAQATEGQLQQQTAAPYHQSSPAEIKRSQSAVRQRNRVGTNFATDLQFMAKPIQSYNVPISTSYGQQTQKTIMSPVAATVTQEETLGAEKISATQRRFPKRDTHTVHIKRKLDANPSLAAIAGIAPRQPLQRGSSKSDAKKLGKYASASQSQSGFQSAHDAAQKQRRPVTGTVRGPRSLQKNTDLNSPNLPPSTAQSTTAGQPASFFQQAAIFRQMQRLSLRAGVPVERLAQKASATASTMTGEEEFCEVPQSELPDRILAFMENNDLPVFIDKKKCNTIKFRTSRPEMKIMDAVHRLSMAQEQAFQIKQNKVSYASEVPNKVVQNTHRERLNFMKSEQFRMGKNVTLVLESQPTIDKQDLTVKKEETAQEAISPTNLSNRIQHSNLTNTDKRVGQENSRPLSSKPTSGPATQEIQKDGKKHPLRQTSGSGRRHVVVKNNAHSMHDTSTIERSKEKQAALAARDTNETPQIINIVKQNQHQPSLTINQDLGIESIGLPNESSARHQSKSRSSIELGTTLDRNKTLDHNSTTLPRPLFLKSKTFREGGRHSAKVKGTNTSQHGAHSKTRKHITKANSIIPSQNNFSASQISQQNKQRSKAFTPSAIPDSAIQSPQQQTDVISVDHPMADYVANATYPISKTCSPDADFE